MPAAFEGKETVKARQLAVRVYADSSEIVPQTLAFRKDGFYGIRPRGRGLKN
jgi:hypothetical protein